MNKDERSSQNVARKFLITNSKQLEQNMNAKFYRKNYGVSKKDFLEVHQQNLIEMEELRKFQYATPDTPTRQKSTAAPYPQELNSPWKKTIEEPLHMSTVEKSERPERSQDLRCQSGPSAKDSVIFSGGDYSKNYGADQQRLQISDLHFDKFPTPATFACWKIRFKTEVCTCSQFTTEAMRWIKEVELVDSVDEVESSSSVRGISMPNFEVLDARITSALNKIIQNSQFKRRISLENKKRHRKRTVFFFAADRSLT